MAALLVNKLVLQPDYGQSTEPCLGYTLLQKENLYWPSRRKAKFWHLNTFSKVYFWIVAWNFWLDKVTAFGTSLKPIYENDMDTPTNEYRKSKIDNFRSDPKTVISVLEKIMQLCPQQVVMKWDNAVDFGIPLLQLCQE